MTADLDSHGKVNNENNHTVGRSDSHEANNENNRTVGRSDPHEVNDENNHTVGRSDPQKRTDQTKLANATWMEGERLGC